MIYIVSIIFMVIGMGCESNSGTPRFRGGAELSEKTGRSDDAEGRNMKTQEDYDQAIIELQDKSEKESETNHKLKNYLKGVQPPCMLGLPVKTMSIQLSGVTASGKDITDNASHHSDSEPDTDLSSFYLRFGTNLVKQVLDYALFAKPHVFAVNLAYTINSIEKIEIIQNGDQYFSNEDWTIKSLILSVGALQSPVEVYSADNLNKRFSGDGSRIIINKEELTNNLAYQKMLENKNCGN
ncbi:MAG: hypothetical protein OXC40_05065 [Proteobacteria bacterium]|nr:hypothetical protein [Pseudomonadota bacterium]